MSSLQTLEHSEHISHAGHGHEHGHGHDAGHGAGEHKDRLGTYVGITMAILGVLLAFCAAKVGGERTELVQSLVEQSNAQAQYHAQDVKHRVAFLALQEVHAISFGQGAAPPNRGDMLMMARTVERYLEESHLAKEWSEAYEPAIQMHVHAQEHYETAQLLAEIGIVVASVALLIKKRLAWFLSLGLGAGAVFVVGQTYVHGEHVIHEATHHIEETQREYFAARQAHKTTTAEQQLVEGIVEWAEHGEGTPPAPHAAQPAAAEPARAPAPATTEAGAAGPAPAHAEHAGH